MTTYRVHQANSQIVVIFFHWQKKTELLMNEVYLGSLRYLNTIFFANKLQLFIGSRCQTEPEEVICVGF